MRHRTPIRTQRKFMTDVVFRTVTQFLLGFRGLLILPILARKLGYAQYGIWSQIVFTAALLAPVFSLHLSAAFVRYFSSETRTDQGRMMLSVLLGGWGILAVAFLITLPMQDALSSLIFSGSQYAGYVRLLFLYVATTMAFELLHTYYRAVQQIKLHSLIRLGCSGLELAVIALVLLVLQESLHLAVAAASAVQGLFAGLLLFSVIRRTGFSMKPDVAKLCKYLRYALPLIPNAFLASILNFGDRYVITGIMGLEAVGIYSAAYRGGQIVKLIMASVSFVLLPLVVRLWEERQLGRVKSYMNAAMKYYMLLGVPAVAGITYFGPDVLRILAGETTAISRPLLFYITTGLFVMGFHELYCIILYLSERTLILPLLTLFSSALNIGLNLWLVPHIGLIGAALSTLICYSLQTILVVLYGRLQFALRVSVRLAAKSLFCAGVMYAAMTSLPSRGLLGMLGVSLLGLVVYVGTLVLVKGVGRQDLELLRTTLKR